MRTAQIVLWIADAYVLAGVTAALVYAPDGAVRWYVLADADGEPLDEVIRLHIGEPLTLTGRVPDAPDLHEFRLDQKSVERLLPTAAASMGELSRR